MAINLSDEEIQKLMVRSEAIFRELHAEMRILRDTELKLVPLFFQISAFIVAANVFVVAERVPRLFTVLVMTLSTIFVLGFWIHLHKRISHDHAGYRRLGKQILFIREQWGVANFFKLHQTPLGTGPGSRKNQMLIAWSGGFVILLIAIGLAAKLKGLA